MARSRSRAGGGKGRTQGGRKAQATSKKKPKAAPVENAEVEVVDETGGAGIESGVAIMTTLALVGAILLLDYFRGSVGEGVFF